jgi:membrane fusion protein (multidrug efflux system)
VQKIGLVLSDASEYPETGKLNYSASAIDPLLGTQQLRAEFVNADRKLLPGQFVKAKITTGTRDGVFLVPQTAVLTGDQGKFVYVAEKDASGKVVAGVHPIQEGGWEGQQWVVLSGLKAGDQVIVDNLIKVRPGAAVKPTLAGMQPAVASTQPKVASAQPSPSQPKK